MVEQLRAAPASVMGLETGGIPLPVYARLVESYRAGRFFSWMEATTFKLDEYIGLGSEHPAPYAAYMRRHLFDLVVCPAERRHIPDRLAQDIAAAVSNQATTF